MANKIFNLDLTKDTKINSIVLGRVGDGGLQTITVNISNRDVPVDLTGFTITFEGVTNSSQSKIFDSYGVKTETEKLKQGQFDYTFPSAAFSVAGRYETAYFSFQKDENRDTTGKIDIFVSENADIDAGEAESIITEYNKLVQELHEITDKYISDSDAKFSDLNAKIADLQTKITQYQNTVKDTADAAIKAVDDALKKFEAGDFYTKSETDAKFKVVNDLIISQDIPEGANLDDYKKEGEFSKKTPTVVTGAPEGATGAFRLSVRAMVGSSRIFQTLYDYATRGIYYRVGNTSHGFNLPWQRIANNSEVVHLTGDETIAGKKTFTDTATFKDDTDWQETALSKAFKGSAPQWKCYRGKEVRVNFSNLTNNNQLSGNAPYTIFNLPEGYRPKRSQEDVIIIRVASNWTLTRLLFNTDGTVQIVPANTIPVNTGFGGTSKISIE